MWTKFVKVLLYVVFIIGIVGALLAAYLSLLVMGGMGIISYGQFFVGGLVFIGGIFFNMLLVCGGMILVETSENIAKSKEYLRKISENQKNTHDSANAVSLPRSSNSSPNLFEVKI